MKIHPAISLLCLLCLSTALAQQIPSSNTTPPPTKLTAPVTQSITVTTTHRTPPLAESNRSVNLTLPARTAPPLELRRRPPPSGPLSQPPGPRPQRRSGRPPPSAAPPSSQSLIYLLNGLRINDPETGHLNLDIPIPTSTPLPASTSSTDRDRHFTAPTPSAVPSTS